MAPKSRWNSGQTVEDDSSKAGRGWQVWGNTNMAKPRSGPSTTVSGPRRNVGTGLSRRRGTKPCAFSFHLNSSAELKQKLALAPLQAVTEAGLW